MACLGNIKTNKCLKSSYSHWLHYQGKCNITGSIDIACTTYIAHTTCITYIAYTTYTEQLMSACTTFHDVGMQHARYMLHQIVTYACGTHNITSAFKGDSCRRRAGSEHAVNHRKERNHSILPLKRPHTPLPPLQCCRHSQRWCTISVIPSCLQPRALSKSKCSIGTDILCEPWRKRCRISSVKGIVGNPLPPYAGLQQNGERSAPRRSALTKRGAASCHVGGLEVFCRKSRTKVAQPKQKNSCKLRPLLENRSMHLTHEMRRPEP